MLECIHHVSFTVSNMEKSLAFYRDLLEMSVIWDSAGEILREDLKRFLETITGMVNVKMRLAYLDAGNNQILELIQYFSPDGVPVKSQTCDPGSTHVAFFVDDIWQLYTKLTAEGIQFKSPPVKIVGGPLENGHAAYFLDPDGITIEPIQKPAK